MPWAKQGVLMLNTILTLRAGEPLSHKGRGWETFTDEIIRKVSDKTDPVVFVLWGKPAQGKIKLIDTTRHTDRSKCSSFAAVRAGVPWNEAILQDQRSAAQGRKTRDRLENSNVFDSSGLTMIFFAGCWQLGNGSMWRPPVRLEPSWKDSSIRRRARDEEELTVSMIDRVGSPDSARVELPCLLVFIFQTNASASLTEQNTEKIKKIIDELKKQLGIPERSPCQCCSE